MISTFALGWDKLHTGQRFERAKYIVEKGLNAGMNAVEIAEDLIDSANPIGQPSVCELIDLYAIGTGVTTATGNTVSETAFSAGRLRLRSAWEANVGKVDVSDADVAKVRKQFPKADQVTVERIAMGRAIGERLLDNGKIDVDDDGGFHLNTPDPRSVQKIKDESTAPPVDMDAWRDKFKAYSTDCRKFTTFLRASKQSMLTDDHLSVQLKNIADAFREQSDRFTVGVAKAEARS